MIELPELPVLKLRELLRALSKLGFETVSQKGSHIKLKKASGERVLVVIVPSHAEIRRGTLKSIMRQAGISREDFLKIIEER